MGSRIEYWINHFEVILNHNSELTKYMRQEIKGNELYFNTHGVRTYFYNKLSQNPSSEIDDIINMIFINSTRGKISKVLDKVFPTEENLDFFNFQIVTYFSKFLNFNNEEDFVPQFIILTCYYATELFNWKTSPIIQEQIGMDSDIFTEKLGQFTGGIFGSNSRIRLVILLINELVESANDEYERSDDFVLTFNIKNARADLWDSLQSLFYAQDMFSEFPIWSAMLVQIEGRSRRKTLKTLSKELDNHFFPKEPLPICVDIIRATNDKTLRIYRNFNPLKDQDMVDSLTNLDLSDLDIAIH